MQKIQPTMLGSMYDTYSIYHPCRINPVSINHCLKRGHMGKIVYVQHGPNLTPKPNA